MWGYSKDSWHRSTRVRSPFADSFNLSFTFTDLGSGASVSHSHRFVARARSFLLHKAIKSRPHHVQGKGETPRDGFNPCASFPPSLQIGINGFGRIGRLVLRSAVAKGAQVSTSTN